MNTFLSKSIRSGVALGGVVVALLAGAEPAQARKTQCQIKYTGCVDRCVARHDTGYVSCINRTCDRQYDNCAATEGGGGGKGGKGGRGGFVANAKQTGPVASGPQTPRIGGRTGPFVPNKQGPFVPGGMKRNGGTMPGGAIVRSASGRR